MTKALIILLFIISTRNCIAQFYTQKECRYINSTTDDTADGLGHVIKTASGGFLFAGTGIDGVEVEPNPFGPSTYFSAASAEFLTTDVDLNFQNSSCYSYSGFDERKDISVKGLAYGSNGESYKLMYMFYNFGLIDEHLKIEGDNFDINFWVPGMQFGSSFFYDWDRKKFIVTSTKTTGSVEAHIYQIDTANNYLFDKKITDFHISTGAFDEMSDSYYFIGIFNNIHYPVLFSTDTIGNILWAKTYVTTDTIFNNNLYVSKNSIYIISTTTQGGQYNCVLQKIDKSSGNTQFCRVFNLGNDYIGRAILEKKGAVYLLAGKYNWPQPGYSALIKLDTLGNYMSSKALPYSYNFCYNDSLSDYLVIAGSKLMKLSLDIEIDSICPPLIPLISSDSLVVADSSVVITTTNTNTIGDCFSNCYFSNSTSSILYNTVCNRPIPVYQQNSFNNVFSLNVYPNPTKNLIKVNSSDASLLNSIRSIEIKSIQGYILLNKNPEMSTSLDIDISNLSSGIYLLSIKMKDGSIYLQKVIKQ